MEGNNLIVPDLIHPVISIKPFTDIPVLNSKPSELLKKPVVKDEQASDVFVAASPVCERGFFKSEWSSFGLVYFQSELPL